MLSLYGQEGPGAHKCRLSMIRKELELTDLALPERIVKLACENYKLRERDRGVTR